MAARLWTTIWPHFMAVIYPDNPLGFNNSEGERSVFHAIKSLDERCSVFYSLAWLNPRYREWRSALQGEADFVIIDPRRGLLVIEVKGGGIRYEANCWIQTNTATGEEFQIDPVAQANRSAHFLRNLITTNVAAGRQIGVFHAVWFPSVAFNPKALPLDCTREMILDEKSLSSPTAAIDTVFDFWQKQIKSEPLTAQQERAVLGLIAPAYGVMPSFRSSMEARERQFVRLTAEQARIFDYLDEQERAVIGGPAGSGKTLLALEIARRLSSAGQHVAYLCFNAALRRFLRTAHAIPRVTFDTFHSYAAGNISGKDLTFAELEGQFLAALEDDAGGIAIPNLIIDEGQDFESDWIEWLAYRTEGRVFVFYDRNQLLFRSDLPAWIEDADCRLTLKRICRNTHQIARTVARTIQAAPMGVDGLPGGSKPKLYRARTERESGEIVARVIDQLTTRHALPAGDIAVLTPETTESSTLARMTWPKCPVSHEFGDPAVCFTTIRKFKGLEARVLILADIRLEKLAEPDYRRLFYVGCSRAVHELHIVLLQPDEDGIRTAIGVLGDGTKRSPTLRSIGFLLATEVNDG
jgi:RecA/RadA recombinase